MKLATAITGSGDPLVLLHGMGSSSLSAWKVIRPELDKRFTVISFDLPGHGETPFDPFQKMDPLSLATLIVEQLDRLEIPKVHVAGNSLGGWIGLEMAAAFPDRVKTLTGLAPAGLWLVPTYKRTLLGSTSRYLAASTYKVADQLMKLEPARKLGFAEVSPIWRELPHDVVRDAVIAYGSSEGYFPAWDGMLKRRFDKSIDTNIPVTIIFGDTDNTLPEQTSQERSLAPQHARWVTLPQSGHAPMWDRPAECVAEIIHIASLVQ